MATNWQKVGYDVSKEDQVQSTLADDGSVTTTLTLTYVAVTAGAANSDPTQKGTTTDALTATDGTNTVPAVGSLIEAGSTWYTVKSSQPRRTGPFSFSIQIKATFKYTPPVSGKSNVSIRFSGQQITQDAYHDKDQKAVVNSAGQTFDPSVPEGIYDERIEVSYTTTYDQSAAFNGVRGCVNGQSVSFNIKGVSRTFGARCLKAEDVQETDTLPQQDGTPVYNVTASFTNRTDGYITNVLDQGLYELATDGTNITPILDDKGKPVTVPVPLDGAGHPLARGGTPNYIPFKLENEADFSSVFTGLS